MIQVGDIVELMQTNQRNRQLRKQEGKHIWKVIKVDRPQCMAGELGFLIEAQKDPEHTRWVPESDILVLEYKENVR